MKLLKGLKIRPLDAQINTEPHLTPQLPFSLLLSASKGKGKSSTLINMLINKDMLAGKFNRIEIVSPTNKLDAKFNILRETAGIIVPNFNLIKKYKEQNKISVVDYGDNKAPEYITTLTEENFTDDVSITLLKSIIDEQKEIIEKYGKSIADSILIVYDDCASEKRFWNSQAVQKLMFNSRHYKVSLIISTQNYKSISVALRKNMSVLILYFTANKDELKQIYDENGSNLDFKQFHTMFKTVCNAVPFNFLTINYQNSEKYGYEECFERFIKN